MEMRSTFHLKFHMRYFKTTFFQYGKNQKILMGLMTLFRKRKIKDTKRCRTCGHNNTVSLPFHTKIRLQVFVLHYLLLEKKMVQKVPIGQKAKAFVEVTSDLLSKRSSSDAHSSTAPFSPATFRQPAPVPAENSGTEEQLSENHCVWALTSK